MRFLTLFEMTIVKFPSFKEAKQLRNLKLTSPNRLYGLIQVIIAKCIV